MPRLPKLNTPLQAIIDAANERQPHRCAAILSRDPNSGRIGLAPRCKRPAIEGVYCKRHARLRGGA